MDALAQLKAALLGRYVIEREIGRGGMATVYLAHDVRHDRHVALKLLDPELGAVLGAERFLAEIRVTASLQHPNLLPLFDSGEVDGLLFYVMPYVEGESLRARLERERQLRIDDAVHIAAAVAGALEYAHVHGVIHRDLKPENILIHADEPFVADFGIALAVSKAGGPRVTETGLALGTPQYMSPEQAMAERTIDARSDVYSLGAVAYEMLTGTPPHQGATMQAVVARVLTEPPPSIRLFRPAVPEHVADAVATALEKLPADRWASAREFGEALQGRTPARRASVAASSTPRAPRRRAAIASAVAAMALTTGLAATAWHYRTENLQPMQFVVRTRGAEALAFQGRSLTISHDGRTLVYAVGVGATSRLYLRSLDDVNARAIPGTEGGTNPSFSPDGRAVAFLRGDRVMRIDLPGGSPIELATARGTSALSWAGDGSIVLSTRAGLAKVSARGGVPASLVHLDSLRSEFAQNAVVLDDGRTVVYSALLGSTDIRKARVATTTTDGAPPIISETVAFIPLGVVDDYLIYLGLSGPLQAVRFDRASRKTVGAPVTIASDVQQYGLSAPAALSASGTLAYAAGDSKFELDWVDERGVLEPAIRERRTYDAPRLSPDGRRIAVAIIGDGSPGELPSGVWSYDLAAGAISWLVRDSTAYNVQWSADGRMFYYGRGSALEGGLWRVPSDGTDRPSRVLRDTSAYSSFTIAPDDRTLIWNRLNESDYLFHHFLRAVDGDTTLRELRDIPSDAFGLRVSPGGRWLAYKQGTQVFVQPVLGAGPRVQVSTSSGIEPVWSRDGTRLYYRDRTGAEMWAADVRIAPDFEVLRRRKLFEGTFDYDEVFADYDVTADGKRFLMVRILVTTNWREILRHRLRDAR